MAAPTVNTVTPNNGFSIGETFVTIDGTGFNLAATGTVKVKFNGVEATEVKVISSTTLTCLTPRGIPDTNPIDVEVINVTPNPPGPDLEEGTTVVGAFTYRRPNIATRRDHTTDGTILCLTRKLVSDLRQYVIENVRYDTHPEYVDQVSVLEEEEVQASLPSLKIIGPEVQEETGEYRANGRLDSEDQVAPDTWDQYQQPLSLRLTWNYVGVGRTKGEAFNLYEAMALYFERTPELEVFVNGVDDTNGVALFEMEQIWEEQASFRSQATRQAIYQFTGSFEVRGVPALAHKVGEVPELTEDPTLLSEQL